MDYNKDDFKRKLRLVLDDIEKLLVQKNEAYGDSALNPSRIFSKADPAEQIRVRIDDKLTRIAKGTASGEDSEKDLLGYLVLLQITKLNQ